MLTVIVLEREETNLDKSRLSMDLILSGERYSVVVVVTFSQLNPMVGTVLVYWPYFKR